MNKYLLTIGLFDKDTKVQKVSTLEAYKVVENATTSIVGFGTIYACDGIYTHDDGSMVKEPSLRVEINTDDEKSVLELARVLKIALNQESIMLEVVESKTAFI